MTLRDSQTDAAQDAPVRSEDDRIRAAREAILDALPAHVVFDGWSREAIALAAQDAGVDADLARLAFPRGGVDAALAFHRRGDRLMAERLAAAPLGSMRIRDRIAFAVRTRLEVVAPHREAVRRAAALLSLPIHAAEGARAIWDTADAIWTAIGDDSRDVNWYTKRATLAAVYSAVALYWLGDETPGSEATWSFLDRRIEDVMRIEKLKSAFRSNPLGQALLRGPGRVLDLVKAPGAARGAAGPSGAAQAAGPGAGPAPDPAPDSTPDSAPGAAPDPAPGSAPGSAARS